MVMAVTTTKNLNKIIIMAAPFFPRLGCIKLKSPVTLKKKQTHRFIRMEEDAILVCELPTPLLFFVSLILPIVQGTGMYSIFIVGERGKRPLEMQNLNNYTLKSVNNIIKYALFNFISGTERIVHIVQICCMIFE